MAAAWLTVRMRRNYQMLFLATVWLIHDKLQHGGIVLLTLTHAKIKVKAPLVKEHKPKHLTFRVLHMKLSSCWGQTTQ